MFYKFYKALKHPLAPRGTRRLSPIVFYKALKQVFGGKDESSCLSPIVFYKALKLQLLQRPSVHGLSPIVFYKALKP